MNQPYDLFAYTEKVVQMTYASLARSRVLPLTRQCDGCGEELDVRQEGSLCSECILSHFPPYEEEE